MTPYKMSSQILYHVIPAGQFCHPCNTDLATGLVARFVVRGGARGGLEGAIASLSEHACSPSEGEKLFCRRFLAFTMP